MKIERHEMVNIVFGKAQGPVTRTVVIPKLSLGSPSKSNVGLVMGNLGGGFGADRQADVTPLSLAALANVSHYGSPTVSNAS